MRRRLAWTVAAVISAMIVYWILVGSAIGVEHLTGPAVSRYRPGDIHRHPAPYWIWMAVIGVSTGCLTWLAYGWQHPPNSTDRSEPDKDD